jgi:hypothetical protein
MRRHRLPLGEFKFPTGGSALAISSYLTSVLLRSRSGFHLHVPATSLSEIAGGVGGGGGSGRPSWRRTSPIVAIGLPLLPFGATTTRTAAQQKKTRWRTLASAVKDISTSLPVEDGRRPPSISPALVGRGSWGQTASVHRSGGKLRTNTKLRQTSTPLGRSKTEIEQLIVAESRSNGDYFWHLVIVSTTALDGRNQPCDALIW